MKYSLSKSKYQYLSIIVGCIGLILFFWTKKEDGEHDMINNIIIFIFTYLIVSGILGLRRIRKNRHKTP